jgi:hypothetical protein
MFRRSFAFGGSLLLAVALDFLTASPSEAAPRGGAFHGSALYTGGFHAGGFHSSGFHPGGYRYGGHHPYYHNYAQARGHGYYSYYFQYYPYSYGVYPYSYVPLPDYSSGLGASLTGDLGDSSLYYPAQPDTTAPVADPPVSSGNPGQAPMTKVQ